MYQNLINEITKECGKYNYRVEEKFGNIYIKTVYENWYFELTNGKIRLMHRNSCSIYRNDYHEQFCKFISMKDLATYIHEHEVARYTKKFVCFSTNISHTKRSMCY